jgi:hypothetical protein
MLAQDDARYHSTCMRATGIPPWSYLNIEVKDLTAKMKEIREILQELPRIDASAATSTINPIHITDVSAASYGIRTYTRTGGDIIKQLNKNYIVNLFINKLIMLPKLCLKCYSVL